tara:strand:- start:101 stop:520 length:420 start_codon:yes stop_codon:yes gene_type:complete
LEKNLAKLLNTLNYFINQMNKKTEIIFHDPENPETSGYTVINPYETKQKILTDLVPEGFVEIPVFQLIHILSFLYVGERTGREKDKNGKVRFCPFRSKGTQALNMWFKTKKTYKFWRRELRELKEYYDKDKRELTKYPE